MKVFISHPFSASPFINRLKCKQICKKHRNKGEVPICPALHFPFITKEKDNEREIIMSYCLDNLVPACDKFYLYGRSNGCIEELNRAELLGIEIIDLTK